MSVLEQIAPDREHFDYSQVDATTADRLRCLTDQIRNRTSAFHLQTGRDLIEVREALGHGRFGAWLAAEFGWTDRTARHFMNAARFVEGKSEIISDLPITAINHLAVPSLPVEIRDGIIGRLESGEVLSVKEIKAAIDQKKQQLAAEQRDRDRQARLARMTPDEIRKFQKKEKARRRSREQREAEKRHQQEEWQRLQIEEDQAAGEIVALLTARLGDDLSRLRDLLGRSSWYKVQARLGLRP